MKVVKADLDKAIKAVVADLKGIEHLYPGQYELLTKLFDEANIFYTSSTNSGKTLPGVIFPAVMMQLDRSIYTYPNNPKVLFLTALNSIQLSLIVSLRHLGIACDYITHSQIQTHMKTSSL